MSKIEQKEDATFIIEKLELGIIFRLHIDIYNPSIKDKDLLIAELQDLLDKHTPIKP